MAQRTSGAPTRRRRYGVELEAALLEAGWDELADVGYARLTMGSVAMRAHTSEPVLYRRWANKDELIFAALVHYGEVNPVAVPDTGALRSDMLAQLKSISDSMAGYFAVVVSACFSGLLADAGLSPAEARDRVLKARDAPRVRVVYQQARDRGELDLTRVPAAVLALPFDLVRHDLLLALEPLRAARIRSIVDELFLPLVQLHMADGRRRR